MIATGAKVRDRAALFSSSLAETDRLLSRGKFFDAIYYGP